MKIAIIQPTYLPWIGYFGLIDRVDLFVRLDSVYFSYQSWQQHNQIKTSQGVQRLTVPVLAKSKGRRAQLIYDVEIDKSNSNLFPKKHIRSIEINYSQALYYQDYANELFVILNKDYANLSLLNENLIFWGKEVLGIKTSTISSKSVLHVGTKAELIANMCKELGASQYISPPAARSYIEATADFQENDIEVIFHEYNHPVYPQCHGEFLPYMSFIDLLFNVGPGSLKLIRQGVT